VNRPLVEILYLEGCPNYKAARQLVEQVSGELGIEPKLRLIKVANKEEAKRLRFPGSPTVRIDGRDVDPHADERCDFGLTCRLYRTEGGFAGQPTDRWVRDALSILREALS